MAKLIFLGTCAGTEPMPGMQHASVALEVNGFYYWFDAGEGCARSAHLSGMNLSDIKSVFISHPHMDHMGGLLHLLWTIQKLGYVKGTLPPDNKVNFYISDPAIWEHFHEIMKETDPGFGTQFTMPSFAITDGVIYEDENISVEAIHNHHILGNDRVPYLSYSFRIRIGEKKVIYSGDVKDMDDLRRIIGDGCDYLLMETGHHKVLDVCKVADEMPVGKLLFTHHGRAIINDPEQAAKEMESCSKNPLICRDGMQIEIL